jgi:hypothetical protein
MIIAPLVRYPMPHKLLAALPTPFIVTVLKQFTTEKQLVTPSEYCNCSIPVTLEVNIPVIVLQETNGHDCTIVSQTNVVPVAPGVDKAAVLLTDKKLPIVATFPPANPETLTTTFAPFAL